MLIRDTEAQRVQNYRKAQEAQLAQKMKWAKEQEADCIFVENEYISPANEERQLGRILSATDLELRLKKIIPNIHFEVNPFNPLMKALYMLHNGQKNYICSYHNGIMPEHSVIKLKEELVWDPQQTLKPLNRKDLPKHEWVSGKGFVFDETAPRPGWKKIKKPNGELKRGWRTVLLKLVLANYVSITSVERTFNDPTSPFGQRAWAYHTGKTTNPELAIPW